MMKRILGRIGLTAVLASALGVGSDVHAEKSGDNPKPDPLVIAFAKQKDPREIREDAQKLTDILEERMDTPVEVIIPTSYGAIIQAMISDNAHVGYMDALPFMLAKQEAPIDLLMAEEREGRSNYDSLVVVKKDAPYESLEDLRGKHIAFTSQTSTSGYLLPMSRLVNEGYIERGESAEAFFGRSSFAGGYTRALQAVLNGHSDAAAVSDYTLEGEKADVYLDEEQRNKLRVLVETPGVPTHVLCVRSDLPESVKKNLKAALTYVDEHHTDLLADVYGTVNLIDVSEKEHLQAIRQAIKNTGVGLERLAEAEEEEEEHEE